MHQMKKVIPAVGATMALRVKRCRIVWMGNQMAGREISQKRKKHIKSLVLVPDEAGIVFGILFKLGHIDRNITFMQSPPMLAWTPYQIHAIAPLLKTHQRLPQIPKEVRATTGNVTWNIAPGRALATIKGATMPYPIQTHSHACHHDRPS
jgi:hypothetical protein